MPARAPMVVFGSLNVDSSSYVAEFPSPGETILAHGFRVALGGKGSNQAVAAHVAGASVDLVARIGTDASGDFAVTTLERFGVSTGAIVRIADAPTGVAQITVADSGENTVIVTGGANLALTPAVVDAERDRIAASALVLTQGELPVDTIERLAAVTAELGVRFVLNLAPPAPVGPTALRTCDPLVPHVSRPSTRRAPATASRGPSRRSSPRGACSTRRSASRSRPARSRCRYAARSTRTHPAPRYSPR